MFLSSSVKVWECSPGLLWLFPMWVHVLRRLPVFPQLPVLRPAAERWSQYPPPAQPQSVLSNYGPLMSKYPACLPLGWDFFEVCPIPCPTVTQQELPEVPAAHPMCCFLAPFPLWPTFHLLQDPLPNKSLQSRLCLCVGFWRNQSQTICSKSSHYHFSLTLSEPVICEGLLFRYIIIFI